MKNLKLTVTMILMSLLMAFTFTNVVKADDTTALKSLKVYAVDKEGKETKVKYDFDTNKDAFDLTVMSDTVSISIKPVAKDSTSTCSIEKEWVNTKMDTGKNKTVVDVKSATGTVKKYTLNTTKLTKKEEATYQAESSTTTQETKKSTDNAQKTETTDTSTKPSITIGKSGMKIYEKFSNSDIPEGFVKDKAKYNGKEYVSIKGSKKDLTAFYLKGKSNTEGFYIYDSNKDDFYLMQNIKVKSRMYTIVSPKKTDSFLKDYSKSEVTIIDEKVEAWALDESNGMYLVYAMNWNGDTSLYCYDDNEKCMQRYLTSNDSNAKVEAANKAYDNMQSKYNSLVDKYNIVFILLCVMGVVIVIMLFIILNLILKKKEKAAIEEEIFDDKSNENDIDFFDKDEKIEDNSESETPDEDNSEEDKEEEAILAKEVNETIEEDSQETDDQEADVDDQEADEDTQESSDNFDDIEESSINLGRIYGDVPTLNLEGEDETEGFYGGEKEEEDEILIDLADNEPAEDNKEDDDIEFIDM